MQKLLIIILILIFNLTFGQEKIDRTDSIITKFKTKLNDNGVSDFLVIKQITYGIKYIPDLNEPNSCYTNTAYFAIYAFWSNGKKSYVKKFDNCGEFKTLKLSSSKPINFFKSNYKKIKSEKVKPYQIISTSHGKDGLAYKINSFQTHQPQRYFWFFTKSMQFTNHFDTYNLTTEKDKPNFNYKSNKELKLVKLNAICEEIINEFEDNNMFNRIK